MGINKWGGLTFPTDEKWQFLFDSKAFPIKSLFIQITFMSFNNFFCGTVLASKIKDQQDNQNIKGLLISKTTR